MTAYGPLQRNIYNDENVEHYDYDPEKAKSVLEEAGCEMGDDGFYYRDGEKVGFVISVGAGYSYCCSSGIRIPTIFWSSRLESPVM